MYIMWYAQNSIKNNFDNDDSLEDKRARNKNIFHGKICTQRFNVR